METHQAFPLANRQTDYRSTSLLPHPDLQFIFLGHYFSLCTVPVSEIWRTQAHGASCSASRSSDCFWDTEGLSANLVFLEIKCQETESFGKLNTNHTSIHDGRGQPIAVSIKLWIICINSIISWKGLWPYACLELR